MIKDYKDLLRDLGELRKTLLSPKTPEEYTQAQDAAVTLFKSTEFGNFVSLSPLYNTLHKNSKEKK